MQVVVVVVHVFFTQLNLVQRLSILNTCYRHLPSFLLSRLPPPNRSLEPTFFITQNREHDPEGFSVRVLVRNLYSSTLDLLGTGANFAQGDLTDYRTIVDAVSGVDKVSVSPGDKSQMNIYMNSHI